MFAVWALGGVGRELQFFFFCFFAGGGRGQGLVFLIFSGSFMAASKVLGEETVDGRGGVGVGAGAGGFGNGGVGGKGLG